MGFLAVLLVCLFVMCCEAAEDVEERGKKKLGLFIFFADLVIKKIFILKLVYAFVIWAILHKAGYFFGWFLSYLKEQKHEHVEHHGYHDHHPEHHYEYGPPDHYKRKSGSGFNPYAKPSLQYSRPYRNGNPY